MNQFVASDDWERDISVFRIVSTLEIARGSTSSSLKTGIKDVFAHSDMPVCPFLEVVGASHAHVENLGYTYETEEDGDKAACFKAFTN